jgi:hypothetical protein
MTLEDRRMAIGTGLFFLGCALGGVFGIHFGSAPSDAREGSGAASVAPAATGDAPLAGLRPGGCRFEDEAWGVRTKAWLGCPLLADTADGDVPACEVRGVVASRDAARQVPAKLTESTVNLHGSADGGCL